jgi:hypothetical protein
MLMEWNGRLIVTTFLSVLIIQIHRRDGTHPYSDWRMLLLARTEYESTNAAEHHELMDRHISDGAQKKTTERTPMDH